MTTLLSNVRKTAPRGATPLHHTGQSSRLPAWARDLRHWTWAAGGVGLLLVTLALTANDPSDDTNSANLPPAKPDFSALAIENPIPVDTLEVHAPEPQWMEQTVGNGDNLSLIFARAGFSDRDVYKVTRADGGRALRKIYPGETIAFLSSPEGDLEAVKHVESRLKSTTFSRTDDGFDTTVTVREPELRQQSATMLITSSLFMAGQDAGLSNRVIMDLAGIFGGVIDFALDPREGDTIELLFEEQWLDGEKLADGDILAAAFTNKGETFEAYRYTDSEGDTSYYNELGVSMRKAFLKAPVDFTRVSSNFNPNRLHPIHKTKRPHRGTDYAAPTGTPVYAAGDGRVVKSGYTSANGNYVFIQHGESFKTHYLHLHKRRVKQGERVKQGQVIGTVGSTGSATGPHLHYEFLVDGVHRNPRSVHKLLPKAKSLPNTELARFEAQIRKPLQQLAAIRQTRTLALTQGGGGTGGE